MISGSKNDSRLKNKKGAKKQEKMVFAKDKKQAVIALVVFGIFFCNLIYMLSKSAIEKANEQSMIKKAEAQMAEKQKNDLESLSNPAAQPDPSTNPTATQDTNDIYNQTLSLQGGSPDTTAPPAISTPTSDDSVEILPKKQLKKFDGKRVLISVESSGRSNPFLPASENIIPSSLPKFNLTAPPEIAYTNSEASKVMTTTISGILYDKYSPSAIIKIEGADYLVKRGDIINHYRILSISKDQVIVQLGKNIYKAGVGQLLEPTTLNYNTIANLDKKFAGNSVSINVKRKGS